MPAMEFQICAGKYTDHSAEVGLCSRIVTEGLEDHWFELYTDNYYTSPQLFLTLYKKVSVAVEQQVKVSLKHWSRKKETRGYYE